MNHWLITINYAGTCPECTDSASFQAHSADVARRAYVAMTALVDNEAGDSRLKCGCSFGYAKIPQATKTKS
jgi:hypothetical protein